MPPRKTRRTDGASSSRAPPPTDPIAEDVDYEQPEGLCAVLPMVCESNFIIDDFQDNDLALFGLQYIHTAGLQALFVPQRTKAYQRLVRVFYQHLDQTSASGAPSLTFSSSIDGIQITINEAIVARALGVPLTQPDDCPFDPQNVPEDINEIAAVISRGAIGPGASVRRSQLEDDLLFLDSLLEKNLDPAGHKERRDEHVKALFSAMSNQWFSPARLVLRCFQRTFNAVITDKSRSAKLYFPLLISRILELLHFPIPPNEEQDGAPLRFDEAQFNASLSRIPRLKGRQDAQAPAAGSRLSPSMQFLADRFDSLSTRVDQHLDAFQARLDDGMEEMLTMQEMSLYPQFGDQYEAALAETRRRRYARRNQ